ncbi:tetratricopeptide repeat protein, partial [Candidatus Poribacteria bacterium]|nr:tetratricopeptide repeat protein [Candidatus Poribacteria bacterium]
AARRALFTLEAPKDLKKLVKAEELIGQVESNPAKTQRNLESAVKLLDEVVKRHPDYWDARLLRGIAFRRSGDLDAGEVDFLAVMAQEPDQPLAILNLGLVARERRDSAAALGHVRRAFALAPKDLQIVLNTGFVALDSGECPLANEALSQARVLVPAGSVPAEQDPVTPLADEIQAQCGTARRAIDTRGKDSP